ncbi:hypothetical protein MNB_SV-13-1341 [hydrothermal vent metagenome]|uniref:DUF3108 domain-containing protein n=1 Tax=hydrothermal vent metagenome TaxID=652676 RepID=A0A1W1D083_9ZZZZ
MGKVGVAKALLEIKGNTYTIDIELSTTGMAKFLTQGRTEHHISKGHIRNNMLISDFYSVEKSHGKVQVKKFYTFDHKNKKIAKEFKKYKSKKEIRHETEILEFYTQDDLLTLYFNLDQKVKDKNKAYTYRFKTVGAEGQEGKVSLKIPKAKYLKKYKKILGEDKGFWYATVIIHQKIFSSKEGQLMLAIDQDGITNQAVLKDVIFFGDIRAVRIK